MEDKIYIFNPYYSLRNDRKRILLCNSPAFKIPLEIAENEITTFINPIYGIIFSFFNGENTLQKAIGKISKLFKTDRESIYKLVKPFLNNNKRVGIEYDGISYEFPRMILIEDNNGKYKKRGYNYQDFIINEELDIFTERLFEGPSTVTLLVNTECVTDCIYCYVDRSVKTGSKIPIERIKELIVEAKQIGVVDFNIAGTEIFLYKYWEELIVELLKNGFYPYLSTKIPISHVIIKKLTTIGIKDIQLSIDTINYEEALIVNRLKRKEGYIDKMFKTLENLEKAKINTAINVVLTKYNSSILGIKKLLNKVNKFKNIEKLTLNPAERSNGCSSDDFDKFKILGDDLKIIEKEIMKDKNNYSFQLSFAGYAEKTDFELDFNEKQIKHDSRSLCTANITQFCILNDGQVTICEELYWNPKFLIGNVLEKSLIEVWKSDKATKLANLERNDFRDDSICKTCRNFEECRLGKGVCWSNVATAYGEENWDFPAPECPYAPKLIYSVHHD